MTGPPPRRPRRAKCQRPERGRGRPRQAGAQSRPPSWLLASFLFQVYAANFANYGATYGSLGAVVALLMWFWISAFVVLLGAELNAEMEHQTQRDSTTGPEKPFGARGAYVADHVGEVP